MQMGDATYITDCKGCGWEVGMVDPIMITVNGKEQKAWPCANGKCGLLYLKNGTIVTDEKGRNLYLRNGKVVPLAGVALV
jgi:hypothetical protein